MVVLAHFSNFQKSISYSNKIPEYAKNFKKEWLYIRGINKECERFVKKFEDEDEKIFSSSYAKKMIYFFKRFVKCQERGKIKDISHLHLKEEDVKFIDWLEIELDDYGDLFLIPGSYEFDKEKYENDDTGYKEFFESFTKFKNKLKIEEIIIKNSSNYLGSYSDSDIEDDSDSDSDSDGFDSDVLDIILSDSD